MTSLGIGFPGSAPDKSAPKDYFEGLYADGNDPWEVETSWYERRKYQVTVAALPCEHYESALELGCAFGTMSRLLAPRVDRLTAIDASQNAIDRARSRFAVPTNIRFEQAVLPAEMPSDAVDLIVASELLNYFSRSDLDTLIDRMLDVLKPGGDLVAVHWFTRNPLHYNGMDVHAHLRTVQQLEHLASYEDEQFVLDSFRRV